MEEKIVVEKQPGDYWKKWLHRFLPLLAPSFLLFFTVFFFGPLDIVSENQMYLTFTAGNLVPMMTLITIAGTVVVSAALAFVPGKIHGVMVGLVLAIAVLLYFQGSIMNGDIGTLDGSGFDWHNFSTQAYINIVIWIVVLAGACVLGFFFSPTMKTVGYIACAALVVAQAIALVTVWQPADSSEPNYQLSGDVEYLVSSDENIIVITLDQFNPLIFEEVLDMDPELKEVYKDFLYFDNMSSMYSFTFPSLCYLLTHEEFDTTVPTREAVYNAWHSDSANNFYDTLHDDGYTVNLFLESNYAAIEVSNMVGKVDNVVEAGDLVITTDFLQFVTYMSLYRYLPTMMKNNFYVSTGGILDVSTYQGVEKLHINYDFYTSLLDDGIRVTDDEKIFSWYHLQGAHFPYIVDYDGYLCDEGDTDEDRNNQLHGYLVMVGEFLEQLKENDAYDNSTIIISADHGYFECFQAVCMVKMAGETRDEFTTTSAPVSQEDIMPTILYALGEDYDDYGTTVFDWEDGDSRVRTTRVWGYMSNYPAVDWIGNLNQWDAEANGVHRYNVFGVFHYDGDRETILAKERFWYYYGIADEIQPLYDSYY